VLAHAALGKDQFALHLFGMGDQRAGRIGGR